LVESDKTSIEMTEIMAAITFLFEIVVGDDTETLGMPCLLKILCEYYGCFNIKNKFESQFHLNIGCHRQNQSMVSGK